jgi:hypothetical protein
MAMTLRERVLAVYHGETPDVVPWFADLSHWHNATTGTRWVPFGSSARDTSMIDLHKQVNAGIYLNMGQFFDLEYDDNVKEFKGLLPDGKTTVWRLETPVGVIEERREFESVSYSYNIVKRAVQTMDDVQVFRYAMTRRRYVPRFERYHDWLKACGSIGLPYASLSYSGLGFLISRFMGIDRTVYALYDHRKEMKETINEVNENCLKGVEMLCTGPAEVIILGDNFSSDVQPPSFFEEWSGAFYREAVRRIHAAGKHVAVHVDGRLKGLLAKMGHIGIDCIDAVTPAPMGDLTPEECREEAGPDLILWGGIPPALWSRTNTSDEAFIASIHRWLDLRRKSARLVLAPGDQVPPDTDRYRIEMVAEICEQYGEY